VATGVQSIDFELEEAIGYRNVSLQVLETQLLKNIQTVQKENNLFEVQEIERPKKVYLGLNLTIAVNERCRPFFSIAFGTLFPLHLMEKEHDTKGS